jgi:hypothetical protein
MFKCLICRTLILKFAPENKCVKDRNSFMPQNMAFTEPICIKFILNKFLGTSPILNFLQNQLNVENMGKMFFMPLKSKKYALHCTDFHKSPSTEKKFCTELHASWIKNAENMGRISLMPKRKVWVSLHQLSQNSANI